MKVINADFVIAVLELVRSDAAGMVALIELNNPTNQTDLVFARSNLASIDRRLELLKSSSHDPLKYYKDIFNIPTVETTEKDIA